MKVKALASLSTAQGWKAAGEEFTVSAIEADDLVERGLVERSGAVSEPEPEAAPLKPSKAGKGKG